MKILLFIIIMLSSTLNVFAEELETAPSISVYDIGLFAQAAECLSIKATASEKNGFVTAALLDAKVTGAISGNSFDINMLKKQIQMSSKDFDNIIHSLGKHCPATMGKIKYRLDSLNYKNEIFLEELQKIIVAVILPEVISKQDRVKRFEANYTPIGLNSSPY